MKRILIYLLPMLGLFFNCTTEERYIGEGPGPVDENSNEVTLNFSVKVPGQSTPVSSTRAMNETAENHIETIDVLVFEVNSLGDEEYVYRAQGKNVQDGLTASEKSFDVTLIKQSGSKYRLVVLANASSQLNALEPIADGADKELLLQRLIYKNTSEWNASGSAVGTFDPFPMWGESQITAITDNMQVKDLKFLRMVARVDVALNTTISNFKLKEVYVYNRQTSGHIVPGMSDTIWTDVNSVKVKSATIPTGSPTIQAFQNVHLATGDTACIRDIYLMESKAGTSLSDATCIVVGGEYGSSGTNTYYRLDFLESDKVTYKDILRNHLYRFTINSVSGAGHGSADDAFNALPMNMEAEILEWDKGEMSEVVFDGQYMLSVSQGEFTFSKDPTVATDKHNVLSIYTDYNVALNDGWKIEKIVDAFDTGISWLSVDQSSGPSYAKASIHLLLQENTTNADRVGYIYISAGRLNYVIKVTQTDAPDIKLAIYEGTGSTESEITELIFSGRASEISAQQFTVEWAPKTESPLINVNMVGSMLFPFDTGSGSDDITTGYLTGYPGSRTYTVVPPAMTPAEIDPDLGGNPFLEKSSRIDFTVSNGVSYLTKNIFLRQLNYGLTYKTDDLYLLDGGKHSFTVKSNTTWTATVTNDPKNIIKLITTAGGNNTSGELVWFETLDDLTNPSIYQGTAEITFSSPRFNDVVVEINCASGEIRKKSNSYIVKPGGVGILIPVDRANDHLSGAIGTSTAFTAELLWTDNSNRIADNSNIKLVTEAGSGSSGHILVLPGTAEGNAVVAVRSKMDNQIKWSWHIWVTNYDPKASGSSITYNNSVKTTVFMNRNLGATTNTIGSQTSMGLLYQWGRKDPFPGANGTSSTTGLTVYNVSGATSVPAATPTASTGTGTLALTVANPTNYYVGTSTNSYDWYSNTANTKNDNLWNSATNTKTIYDPCPEGWRVPISGATTTSPWYNSSAGTSTTASLYGGTWTANAGWNFANSNYNLGYYPAAGYRYYTNGALNGVGTYGYYWSASPSGVHGYYLFFNSSFVHPSNNANRAYGFSVRCVQE